MGRPPKSTEEHIQNGTYKPSRHEGRGISIEPLESLPAPLSLSKKAVENGTKWFRLCYLQDLFLWWMP